MGSKPSKELGPGKIGRHVPHGVMLVAGDMLGRKGEIMCVRSTQSHDEEVRESWVMAGMGEDPCLKSHEEDLERMISLCCIRTWPFLVYP